MSGASWTPAANANTATWDENKTRADLQRASTTYDDSTITYDSITTYYDGYNPTTTTPEGENPASWTPAANGSPSTFTRVAE